MPQLQRVTTEYIATQDRMKMTGQLESNEAVLLWLHQRLLLRLLPHLFQWLEKQGGDAIPNDIKQSFAQQAATSDLGLEPPVQITSGAQEWLVYEIDVTPNTVTCLLRFKGSSAQEATLPFNSQQLRQWLSIVQKLWTVADWPPAVWPQWLLSSDTPHPAITDTKSLH